MRIRQHHLFLLMTACFLLTAPLHAGVVWTLDNVRFDDDTVATGSFDYDAGTDTYTSWDIRVQSGVFLPAYEYLPGVDLGFVGQHSATMVDFVAFTPGTGRYIRLAFASPLTSSGGIVPLVTDTLAVEHSFECDNCTQVRFIVSGDVTSAPEPATFGALPMAMLVMGALYRRRRGALR